MVQSPAFPAGPWQPVPERLKRLRQQPVPPRLPQPRIALEVTNARSVKGVAFFVRLPLPKRGFEPSAVVSNCH